MRVFFAGLSGGVLGGTVIWVSQNQSFHLAPIGMSYADLAATLLAAVSVIVTILSVAIGALAIWGYKHFKEVASDAAKQQVGSEINDGQLKVHIETTVRDFLDRAFKSGDLRKMLKEQIDRARYSGADDKWADVDKSGDDT